MKKETVYLIRGKNGEYATGTKVCTSMSGAKNSLNHHCNCIVQAKITKSPNHTLNSIYTAWKWWGVKKDFSTYQSARDALHQIGTCLNITQQDYDAFMKLMNDEYDYWYVEEITQNAAW